MNLRYSVYVHGDLLGIVSKRGTNHRKILNFIHSLADDPFQKGDFTDTDAASRPRQIKIIGDFAVTFWSDHAVKAVMIVDISRTDQ